MLRSVGLRRMSAYQRIANGELINGCLILSRSDMHGNEFNAEYWLGI